MNYFEIRATINGWIVVTQEVSRGQLHDERKVHVFTEAVELASFIEANAKTLEETDNDNSQPTSDKLKTSQKTDASDVWSSNSQDFV